MIVIMVLIMLSLLCAVIICFLNDETLVFERYYTRSILKRWIGFRLKEKDRQKLLDNYIRHHKRVAGTLTEDHLKYFVYPLYRDEKHEMLEMFFEHCGEDISCSYYGKLKEAGYIDDCLDSTYEDLRSEYLKFINK